MLHVNLHSFSKQHKALVHVYIYVLICYHGCIYNDWQVRVTVFLDNN